MRKLFQSTAFVAAGVSLGLGAPSCNASPYKVAYAFDGTSGSGPEESLIAVDGRLYGTTQGGGSFGLGTVYSIGRAGGQKTLYNFRGGYDGAEPQGGLIHVNGIFYGTTSGGGSALCNGVGCGTVFSITKEGAEKIVYAFGTKSDADGATPLAGLIGVGGVLFGTTVAGGAYNRGTIFSVTPDGVETVLHSFGNGDDGAAPHSGLIEIRGALYGTTEQGGKYGSGTVFRQALNGAETVLHDFAGQDGSAPVSGLLRVGGAVYGTAGGGANGYGVVYKMSLGGAESVVYAFTGGGDGAYPKAALLNVGGNLYGGTSMGGSVKNFSGGTLFSLAPSGALTTLHSFDGTDGAVADTRLVSLGGLLYGGAAAGGSQACMFGCGVVFSVKP